MPITLDFIVDPSTRRALKKLDRREIDAAIVRGSRRFAAYSVRRLAEVTQDRTRIRTGTLARSWRARPQVDGSMRFQNVARSRASGTSRRPAPYAHFVEFGTRAHFVSPTFAQALVWDKTGKPISAANVKSATVKARLAFSAGHVVSGIQPRRIFRTFLDRDWGQWGRMIVDEFNKLLSAR